MLKLARTFDKDATVGVMLDFGSLPQHGNDGLVRTVDEERAFKLGLNEMHKWYSHPYTHVLMCTTPLPTDQEYSNTKSYHQRGWCYYEMRMSSLVKHRTLLWDLTKFQEQYAGMGLPEDDYFVLSRKMAGKRPVPMSPDDVGKELRERSKRTDDQMLSFSYSNDLEPVIDLYRRGFVHAIESFPAMAPTDSQINFQGLGWDDGDEATLTNAWTYAVKHGNPMQTVKVNLARNRFSKPAAQRLTLIFKGKIRLEGI